MGWILRKKNKYNAVRTNGMASKLEAAVYEILRFKEKYGSIKDIKQQVSVDLGFKTIWKVDFSYYDTESKQTVWVEAKGFKGDRYKMCLKLWAGGQGPGRLEIYEGSYTNPRLVKVIDVKSKNGCEEDRS